MVRAVARDKAIRDFHHKARVTRRKFVFEHRLRRDALYPAASSARALSRPTDSTRALSYRQGIELPAEREERTVVQRDRS